MNTFLKEEKMKKNIFISLTLVLLLTFFAGQASALLIDFNSELPGAPTGTDVILTNQLAGLGVTFSTTDPRGVVWHGPSGTGSFPYVISAGGVCGENEDCSMLPIRVDIDSSITGAFSTVAITGFDGGLDIDTMLMKAFNSSNVVLTQSSLTDDFASPGSTLTVSGANIAYVTFEVTSAVLTPSSPWQHGLFFDNLCIGPCDEKPPVGVPEPATLLLFGVSMVGMDLLRKRFKA
jgi:hypothetical protein